MSLLDTNNLPHKCRIQKRVRTLDAYGGNIESLSTVQSNVACWEQQASASEILAFQKRGMTIDRKIFFPTNPGVTNQNQIVITERQGVAVDSEDEIVLEVKSITKPDAFAGLAGLWRVMANELTSEDD